MTFKQQAKKRNQEIIQAIIFVSLVTMVFILGILIGKSTKFEQSGNEKITYSLKN